MRDLDIYRATLARAARAALGANPLGPRRTEAAARSATLEALIARLPVDVENLEPLQDMDPGSPTHGEFYGTFDLSVFGGDDIFA